MLLKASREDASVWAETRHERISRGVSGGLSLQLYGWKAYFRWVCALNVHSKPLVCFTHPASVTLEQCLCISASYEVVVWLDGKHVENALHWKHLCFWNCKQALLQDVLQGGTISVFFNSTCYLPCLCNWNLPAISERKKHLWLTFSQRFFQ